MGGEGLIKVRIALYAWALAFEVCENQVVINTSIWQVKQVFDNY